jgi:hypothetical protein
MTYPSDDPVPHLTPPEREHTGYGQGIIRAWDPDTFENTVEYRGALLHDLPVLDRIGATTYQPGDVVLLMRWSPTGRGLASYWIAGAPVDPAAGRAEEAIAFLTTSLAKGVSAAVFAERVHEGFVEDSDTLSDQATFVDLDPAGPEITDVNITFGVAIVWPSCSMAGTLDTGPNSVGGYMGVEVSGATTIAADITKSFHLRQTNHNADGINRTDGALAGSTLVLPCAPGLHTFKAVYRTLSGPTTTVSFSQRSLVVIGI